MSKSVDNNLTIIRQYVKSHRLRHWLKLLLIVLFASVALNIGIGVWSSNRIAANQREIESRQKQLDTINQEIEATREQLEAAQNDNAEQKATMEATNAKLQELQQERDKLQQQLQAKLQRQQLEQRNSSTAVAKAISAPSGSCRDWIVQAGVDDIDSAYKLIMRESGCRVNATNPSSGAYGIPQALPGNKMASAGSDWSNNPVTQIRWMNSYVHSRYGGWSAALNFQIANNWY